MPDGPPRRSDQHFVVSRHHRITGQQARRRRLSVNDSQTSSQRPPPQQIAAGEIDHSPTKPQNIDESARFCESGHVTFLTRPDELSNTCMPMTVGACRVLDVKAFK
jgi:hypothetical protein